MYSSICKVKPPLDLRHLFLRKIVECNISIVRFDLGRFSRLTTPKRVPDIKHYGCCALSKSCRCDDSNADNHFAARILFLLWNNRAFEIGIVVMGLYLATFRLAGYSVLHAVYREQRRRFCLF